MKKLVLTISMLCMLLPLAGQTQTFRYSTDLGSDLDLSDSVTPGDNWMDCGDIYVETNATLIKNDDTGTPNSGFPVNNGVQPAPTLIGAGSGATAGQVRSTYDTYYDVDGEDQLDVTVSGTQNVLTTYDSSQRTVLKVQGLHFEPTKVHHSYDDDTAPGWYKSGSIPTTTTPTYGQTGSRDEIMSREGTFGNWVNETGVRTEADLGLAPNPDTDEADDDDVDALDEEQHRYYYWTPDHEANLGYDPGSIYRTDLLASGQNATKAFDDALHIGLREDADIDAFEFTLISEETYATYGFATIATPGEDILMMLFSVDQNDVDNDIQGSATDFHGDESGGLNPNTVYLSNLAGEYVALKTYSDDIDALSVPEPATALLLLISGGIVAMIRRVRMYYGQ